MLSLSRVFLGSTLVSAHHLHSFLCRNVWVVSTIYEEDMKGEKLRAGGVLISFWQQRNAA
jgi:hypothetical protein